MSEPDVDINMRVRVSLADLAAKQGVGPIDDPSTLGQWDPPLTDEERAAFTDAVENRFVDDTPARIVGRGAGKASMLVYAPTLTLEALMQFADDVHFGSRGRVHRWRVIDEVITRGMTPANKRKILRKLGLESLIPDIAPEG